MLAVAMSLRDQLKKANLLSDKDHKRLAHEERVHRKEAGREGLEREQAERQAEIERRQAEERETARQLQERLDADRQEASERAACEDILASQVLRPRRGGQRFYFQLDDGALPWLDVDEATRFALQSGTYWVMRLGPKGSHVYGLLPAAQAKRVGAAIPDVVAWAPGGKPKR